MVTSGDTADIDAPDGGTLTVKGVDDNHNVLVTDSYEIPNPDPIRADWNIAINARDGDYDDYPGNDDGYIKIEVVGRTVTVSMRRNMSDGAYNKPDWYGDVYAPCSDQDIINEFCPGARNGDGGWSNRVTPYGWGNRPYCPLPVTDYTAPGSHAMLGNNSRFSGSFASGDIKISSHEAMGPSPFYINWGDNSDVTYTHDYRNIVRLPDTFSGGIQGDDPASKNLGAFIDWGSTEANGNTADYPVPEHNEFSFAEPHNNWPQYYTSGKSRGWSTNYYTSGDRLAGDPVHGKISPPFPHQFTRNSSYWDIARDKGDYIRRLSEYPGMQRYNYKPSDGRGYTRYHTTNDTFDPISGTWTYGFEKELYTSPSMCAVSDAYILANCPTLAGGLGVAYQGNPDIGYWKHKVNYAGEISDQYIGPDLRHWYQIYFEGLNPPGSRPTTATNSDGMVGSGGVNTVPRRPVDDDKLHNIWDQYWDPNNPATPEQTYDNIHPRPELHDFHGNLTLDHTDGIYKATHTYEGPGEYRPTILYRDLGIKNTTGQTINGQYWPYTDVVYNHVVFLPRFRQPQPAGPHLYRGIQITV